MASELSRFIEQELQRKGINPDDDDRKKLLARETFRVESRSRGNGNQERASKTTRNLCIGGGVFLFLVLLIYLLSKPSTNAESAKLKPADGTGNPTSPDLPKEENKGTKPEPARNDEGDPETPDVGDGGNEGDNVEEGQVTPTGDTPQQGDSTLHEPQDNTTMKSVAATSPNQPRPKSGQPNNSRPADTAEKTAPASPNSPPVKKDPEASPREAVGDSGRKRGDDLANDGTAQGSPDTPLPEENPKAVTNGEGNKGDSEVAGDREGKHSDEGTGGGGNGRRFLRSHHD